MVLHRTGKTPEICRHTSGMLVCLCVCVLVAFGPIRQTKATTYRTNTQTRQSRSAAVLACAHHANEIRSVIRAITAFQQAIMGMVESRCGCDKNMYTLWAAWWWCLSYLFVCRNSHRCEARACVFSDHRAQSVLGCVVCIFRFTKTHSHTHIHRTNPASNYTFGACVARFALNAHTSLDTSPERECSMMHATMRACPNHVSGHNNRSRTQMQRAQRMESR